MTSQKQQIITYQGCALHQSLSSGSRAATACIKEDSDDCIEYSRSVKDLCREILKNTNSNDQFMNKATKLDNLNRFVRFVIKFPPQKSDYGFSLEDILSCLCFMLVDQEREVRAAALRLIRYLIELPADLATLFRLKLDLLVVRSLDTVVDNALERMQSLRLIGHLIHIDVDSVPYTIIRCLHAFGKLDFWEHDRMSKAATALLSEIVLMRPNVLLRLNDISWLVKSILGASNERIIECLVGLICRLTNYPRYREMLLYRDCNIFQELFAPFSDPHFTISSSDKDEHISKTRSESEILLENSKATLRCALKNWCGIISCFSRHPCRRENIPSPMKSMMEAFCHVPVVIQVTFVDSLTEVLRVELRNSEELNRKTEADLLNDDVSISAYELDRKKQYSHNLSTQMDVLIASELIKCGIVQVFLEYLTKNYGSNSLVDKILGLLNYITIQLYDHLPICSKYILGQCLISRHNSDEISLNDDMNMKQNIKDTIDYLYKAANLSLNPENSNFKSLIFERLQRRSLPLAARELNIDIAQLIAQSRITSRNSNEWDYSKIHAILLLIGSNDSLMKIEDVSKFLHELMKFYDIEKGQFHQMTSHEDIRVFGRLGCIFVQVMSCSPFCTAFLALFIDKIRIFLIQAPSRIIATFNASPALAHYLFFIGEISAGSSALSLLEEHKIFCRLGQILKSYEATDNECTAKFIIVSLNYSKSAECRQILKTVLNSQNKRLKRFCIRFLYSLSLLKPPDIVDLCVDLLFERLKDTSLQKAMMSARFLHQMALNENYRDVIGRKNVSLDEVGFQKCIFRCYNLYDESYVRLYREQIGNELAMWKQTYNLKYADLVDDYLTSNFTNCQLSVAGDFLRASDGQKFDSYFLPPHIYGALSSTGCGKSILKAHSCLEDAVAVILSVCSFDDSSVRMVKAAIYCLGHMASSNYFRRTQSVNDISNWLYDIYTSHDIFTVRSAAYHALNLATYNKRHYFQKTNAFVGEEKHLDAVKMYFTNLDRTLSVNNFFERKSRELLRKTNSLSDRNLNEYYWRKNENSHFGYFHLISKPSNVGIKLAEECNFASSEHQAIEGAIQLMCSITIRRQYAEQGLLKYMAFLTKLRTVYFLLLYRIKQETPHIFDSVCFYSDLCDLFRMFDYNLNSRHFLQELFYDTLGLPKFFQSIAQANLIQEI